MTAAPADTHPDADTVDTEHPDAVTDTGARGHRFTLTAAADACNTSKRTLLRHADDLTRHGATKDPEGRWSIPISALLASGFRPNAPRTDGTEHPARLRAPDDTDTLRAELQRVRAELVDAQHRAALAEAQRHAAEVLATERAEHVASLRAALRQLTAAPPPAPEHAPHDPEPERRGWWRRLTGS